MPEDPSHQQRTGQKRRSAIQERVLGAIETLTAERLKAVQSPNGPVLRKLTRADVLRLAGGLDKKTLKKPYHSDLLAQVEAFLKQVNESLPASSEQSIEATAEVSASDSLNELAQLLRATQAAQKDVVSELKSSRAENERLQGRVRELEEMLRSQNGSNVVSIASL